MGGGPIEKLLVFSSTPDVAADNFVVPILAAPVAELGARARDLGFDGLEFLPNPDDLPSPEDLAESVRASDAVVGVINSGRLMTHGYALLHKDADRRRQSIAVFKSLIELGGAVGARIGLGMARGDSAVTVDGPELPVLMCDIFAEIGAHAASNGTQVMLEPADPGYVAAILRVTEAADAAEAVNSPGFAIMLDTYQLDQVEQDIAQGFADAQGRASHIHLYDPDHWPPGVRGPERRLDWTLIRNAMDDTGFRGTGSTVLAPEGDVHAAARTSAAFIRAALG
jgi:D-psicose/D-tagatose/L-ribulose 3-epimerase